MTWYPFESNDMKRKDHERYRNNGPFSRKEFIYPMALARGNSNYPFRYRCCHANPVNETKDAE